MIQTMKIKKITTGVFIGLLNFSFAQQINSVINNGKVVKSSNGTTDKVYLFGVGSTDALQLDKLTASGGISVAVKPSDRSTFFLAFNFGGGIIKKEKSDSVLLNSLYFPDIASTVFTGAIEYSLSTFQKKGNWKSYSVDSTHQLLACAEGSLQQRNIIKDSATLNLNAANINIGLKYRWTYHGSNDNTAIMNIGAYYNGIFINRNNEDNFNALFNPVGNPQDGNYNFTRTINGFSTMVSMQLNSTIIYFRTYTNLDYSRDLAFSVGIKTSGKFISF